MSFYLLGPSHWVRDLTYLQIISFSSNVKQITALSNQLKYCTQPWSTSTVLQRSIHYKSTFFSTVQSSALLISLWSINYQVSITSGEVSCWSHNAIHCHRLLIHWIKVGSDLAHNNSIWSSSEYIDLQWLNAHPVTSLYITTPHTAETSWYWSDGTSVVKFLLSLSWILPAEIPGCDLQVLLFHNSMWRTHGFLYLNPIDNVDTVARSLQYFHQLWWKYKRPERGQILSQPVMHTAPKFEI